MNSGFFIVHVADVAASVEILPSKIVIDSYRAEIHLQQQLLIGNSQSGALSTCELVVALFALFYSFFAG
jgi:hypothetical protein